MTKPRVRVLPWREIAQRHNARMQDSYRAIMRSRDRLGIGVSLFGLAAGWPGVPAAIGLMLGGASATLPFLPEPQLPTVPRSLRGVSFMQRERYLSIAQQFDRNRILHGFDSVDRSSEPKVVVIEGVKPGTRFDEPLVVSAPEGATSDLPAPSRPAGALPYTRLSKPFVIDLRGADEVVERAPKPLRSSGHPSRIIRTPMMHIEGQVPSADGSRITGPPSTAGQGIRIDEHTIYYPERKFTRFTKPFVIDLRGSGQGSIPSPGSSRMIGTPPMQGPRYSFLNPVKIADWKLQMTPDRPRPITIPTGSDSALNTLRQMERRATEREKTQGWLQGLEQQYLRPGTSSVGARVPSLSDKGLGTGVGSLHKGSILNRLGGFSDRLSSGFSPALEGLQNQLSRLSKGLEMPMLSGSRASTVGDLSGIGRLGDFSLRDTGIKLGLERLRQDAWHSPWRSSPSGLSLRDSGGGSLRNLWNAGAGFSSGSTLSASPPSIQLSTSPSLMSSGPGGSPSLNFNPLAPPGLGGVPGFGY
jgi:hypothetical protein